MRTDDVDATDEADCCAPQESSQGTITVMTTTNRPSAESAIDQANHVVASESRPPADANAIQVGITSLPEHISEIPQAAAIESHVAKATDAVAPDANATTRVTQTETSPVANQSEPVRVMAARESDDQPRGLNERPPASGRNTSNESSRNVATTESPSDADELTNRAANSPRNTGTSDAGRHATRVADAAAVASQSAKQDRPAANDSAVSATNSSGTSADAATKSALKAAAFDRPQRQESADEFANLPAADRARHVDASIKLENVTGQPAQASVPQTVDASTMIGHGRSNDMRPLADVLQVSTGHQAGQSTRSDDDDQNLQPQIVRGLTTMLNQRGGVMTMRLDPPDLGDVRVQMTLHQGTVNADFQTSSTQAQALLDKNMAVLRHALEEQGLTVDRLTVQVSPQHQQSMRDDNANNANQGQSQQRYGHDAAGGESRGRHEQASQQHEPKWREADFASLFDPDEFPAFSAATTETGVVR